MTDAIRADVEIAAPPERVFEALTDARQLATWWGGDDAYRTRDWRIDARPGGTWSARTTDPFGRDGTIGGTILTLDAPHRLEYTWRASWEGDAESVVRYELEPADVDGRPGTRLTVTHDVPAGITAAAHSAFGWAGVVVCLARSLHAPEYAPSFVRRTQHAPAWDTRWTMARR
jgi:uncharacterized protein YndB with AHSA1/START domain